MMLLSKLLLRLAEMTPEQLQPPPLPLHNVDMSHMDGWVLAIVAVLGVIGSLGLQWVYYDRRITVLENSTIADHALQTAAETENKLAEQEEMIDMVRRDTGEAIRGMRDRITQIELWTRDNLVSKEAFKEAINRMERAAEIRDQRLENQLKQIFERMDLMR